MPPAYALGDGFTNGTASECSELDGAIIGQKEVGNPCQYTAVVDVGNKTCDITIDFNPKNITLFIACGGIAPTFYSAARDEMDDCNTMHVLNRDEDNEDACSFPDTLSIVPSTTT